MATVSIFLAGLQTIALGFIFAARTTALERDRNILNASTAISSIALLIELTLTSISFNFNWRTLRHTVDTSHPQSLQFQQQNQTQTDHPHVQRSMLIDLLGFSGATALLSLGLCFTGLGFILYVWATQDMMVGISVTVIGFLFFLPGLVWNGIEAVMEGKRAFGAT
ncbi:hypothetical protein YB2330_001843 [Saitoella coloradoensis]